MNKDCNELIVWGAGIYAHFFLESIKVYKKIVSLYTKIDHDIEVKKFIDNDISKQGKVFYNRKIFSPQIIEKKFENLIIITVQDNLKIINFLETIGLKRNQDYVTMQEYFGLHLREYGIGLQQQISILNEFIQNTDQWNVHKIFISSMMFRLGELMIQHYKQDIENKSAFNIGMEYIVKSFSEMDAFEKKVRKLDREWFDEINKITSSAIKENYEFNQKLIKNFYNEDLLPTFDDMKFRVITIDFCHFWFYDETTETFFSENSKGKEVELYFQLTSKKYTLSSVGKLKLQWLRREKQAEKIILKWEKFNEGKNIESLNWADVEEYKILKPYSGKSYWLAAIFYKIKNNPEDALQYVKAGLKNRELDYALNKLAADLYMNLKENRLAIHHFLIAGLLKSEALDKNGNILSAIDSSTQRKIAICYTAVREKSEEEYKNLIYEMSKICTNIRYFPDFSTIRLNGVKSLICMHGSYIGTQYIFASELEHCYTPGFHRCFSQRDTPNNDEAIEQIMESCTFDILKGKYINFFSWSDKANKALIPIMPTVHQQEFEIEIISENKSQPSLENKLSFSGFEKLRCNYLKTSSQFSISSKNKFIVGSPLKMGGDKQKCEKRVVINIWVDGLSFESEIKNKMLNMPMSKKFFSKGVIFNSSYSPAEWTFASAPAIFTGLYPNKTRLFHPRIYAEVDKENELIGECMSRNGYYCMNFSPIAGSFFKCGLFRGFDQSIGREDFSGLDYSIMQMIETLQHLDSTNLFFNLHLFEVHDAAYRDKSVFGTALSIDLGQIIGCNSIDNLNAKSAHIPYSEKKCKFYEDEILRVDRLLGILYSYLSEHYCEDEYIVTLHSDHGMSIVGDEQFVLKNGHIHTPLMARGYGVPNIGLVDNEVVSTIDLYAIFAHLCGYKIKENLDCCLPRVFGGPGREFTITQSLYPGQTYKIAINTLNHIFWLETADPVTVDGKINMRIFQSHIFEKKDVVVPVNNEKLTEYFMHIVYDYTKYLLENDYGCR